MKIHPILRKLKYLAVLTLSAMLAACGGSSNGTTEASQKEKISTFFQAVNSQDVPLFESVVWEGFIQHNPFVPTGRSGIVGLFPTLKSVGTTVENKRIIEDGNFVAVHNFWNKATPFGAEQVVTLNPQVQ